MPSAMYSCMRSATCLGIADQRGAGAAAHQADAGPEIGADLELVAPPAVQARHALLADRIECARRPLRRGDGVVVDAADQRSAPRQASASRLAHDDMEADAEAQRAAALRRQPRASSSIFSATSAGGSPQVR